MLALSGRNCPQLLGRRTARLDSHRPSLVLQHAQPGTLRAVNTTACHSGGSCWLPVNLGFMRAIMLL
eukprot:12930903-Prorocentrum_lima.AAC.1